MRSGSAPNGKATNGRATDGKATDGTVTNGRVTDVWLLVETMGPRPHTLIFDTDRTRRFSSIIRRQNHRGDGITSAILDLVDEVSTQGRVARRLTRSPDNNSEVHVLGAPVHGPHDVVYAVQVLLTPHAFSDDDFRASTRAVGAFEWDPANLTTYHGPTIETEIMGVVDDPQIERVSPEIFKLFDEFPGMAELGEFVQRIQTGTITAADTFDSDLLMTGVDKKQRNAFMTFRAVPRADGTHVLRGIVHDISDVRPPAPATGFNAGMVRSAFEMVDMPDCGIGHLNFPTRVITEWFRDPPPPMDRWSTENAQFHPDHLEVFDRQIAALADGDAQSATFEIRLRFAGTGWILARIDLRAAVPGDMGQGLVKVTPISPPPGEPAPDDPQGQSPA